MVTSDASRSIPFRFVYGLEKYCIKGGGGLIDERAKRRSDLLSRFGRVRGVKLIQSETSG